MNLRIPLQVAAERDRSVCVIGSGPAGLSAAWQLRRHGWQVTIVEAEHETGGMLRHGIPDFRLPRTILDAEIERIRAAGVEISCGVRVGPDVSLDDLRTRYDAVVIAVGATGSRNLPIENDDRIVNGLEFLRRYNRGEAPDVGANVVVVGGGNTAIDCARAAVRLGARVRVLYRRTEDCMPAIREEVEHARNEGVAFTFEQLPDEQSLLGADTVIAAIGADPDLGFLRGSAVAHNGAVTTNFAGVTSLPGVFSCGDAAFGYGTVGQAIASGRKVAEAVTRFLEMKS